MSAPIDVMLIRKLGEHNSEIRGAEGKQVGLFSLLLLHYIN